MAGITDRPFRQLCRQLGAGLTTSEMIVIKDELLSRYKSQSRLNIEGEKQPISIQVAGFDVDSFVYSARYVENHGADIIDLNMGCPAKKVCHKAAGSALLKNQRLVAEILKAVVAAVSVPVTLKIRTGWDRTCRNALDIARIAESEGIHLLAIHGRTRQDKYLGQAEYDTIAKVVSAVNIPVIANGDITSTLEAKKVLADTGANGIMLGRGVQGRPWLLTQIKNALMQQKQIQHTLADKSALILSHIDAIHNFYGQLLGVRMARKHIRWYLQLLTEHWQLAWQRIYPLTDCTQQRHCLADSLDYICHNQNN